MHGSYGHGSEHLPNGNFTQFLSPKTQDIVLPRTPQWERQWQALLRENWNWCTNSPHLRWSCKMHAFCWILGARSVCNLCGFRNLKPRRGLKRNIFPSHIFGLSVFPRRYLKRYMGKNHIACKITKCPFHYPQLFSQIFGVKNATSWKTMVERLTLSLSLWWFPTTI